MYFLPVSFIYRANNMKEQYIVLKDLSNAFTRGMFSTSISNMPSEPWTISAISHGPEIITEEMDRSKVSSLYKHSDIIAIAPDIPMRLIEPLDADEESIAEDGDISWGIKAIAADTSPYSGNGIVVAVLDTGIENTHPAFAGVQIIDKDFTGEGNGDLIGHGTHCAATIFGRNVDGKRIGIAKGVTKALIGKVLSNQGGSSLQAFNGILWAVENGANVISMSLGINFPGYVKNMVDRGLPIELATSRALEGYRANVVLFERLSAVIKARTLIGQATVVISAAGNESKRKKNPEWEVAVSPPAVVEGVISVAALGRMDGGLEIADFSNTGAELSAPGVDINSARLGGGLITKSGTSMAAPHVAGVAALWAERLMGRGQLTVNQLTAKVIGLSTSNGLKSPYDSFDVGAGLAQAPQE